MKTIVLSGLENSGKSTILYDFVKDIISKPSDNVSWKVKKIYVTGGFADFPDIIVDIECKLPCNSTRNIVINTSSDCKANGIYLDYYLNNNAEFKKKFETSPKLNFGINKDFFSSKEVLDIIPRSNIINLTDKSVDVLITSSRIHYPEKHIQHGMSATGLIYSAYAKKTTVSRILKTNKVEGDEIITQNRSSLQELKVCLFSMLDLTLI